MTAPNIVDVAAIKGESSVKTTLTTISEFFVKNQTDSNAVYKINNIVVTNIDGTNAADVTINFDRGGTPYSIVKTVAVPADASLVVMSKETGIYLEENDGLKAEASANGDLVVSCSFEIITEAGSINFPVYYQNLHPNPLDIYSWASTASLNNCTIASDAITGKSPINGLPLKMSVTGSDSHIITYDSSSWNIAEASDGQTWRVRVWSKASVSTTMQLFIFGADSGGSWSNLNPSGGVLSAGTFSITTDWTEHSQDITFNNAGVAFIQVRLDGSSNSGEDIWFDNLQVYRIS